MINTNDQPESTPQSPAHLFQHALSDLHEDTRVSDISVTIASNGGRQRARIAIQANGPDDAENRSRLSTIRRFLNEQIAPALPEPLHAGLHIRAGTLRVRISHDDAFRLHHGFHRQAIRAIIADTQSSGNTNRLLKESLRAADQETREYMRRIDQILAPTLYTIGIQPTWRSVPPPLALILTPISLPPPRPFLPSAPTPQSSLAG